MFDAIEAAKDSINVEVYIFEDAPIGQKFANALIAKERQGVQVNLIYDSFGSHQTRHSFFENLKESGIQVLNFNPVNPLEARVRWSPDERDHRKLLIVDGKIAFTGGINISGVYEGGSRKQRAANELQSWRDTDLEVEGPAVAEFQNLFVKNWQSQNGEPLAARDYFPPLDKKGDDIVRVIGSVPKETSLIYITLISAINNAESKIYLTDPYFAPTREMIESLEAAARRGVDMRILVPGRNDEPLVMLATRSEYSGLLGSGVQIYEWQGKMIHAKTAMIDDVWSTVGSSNLDWWSIVRNYEINAVILGPGFAQQMELMFNSDIERSERVDLQQWENRGPLERSEERFGRMIAPML